MRTGKFILAVVATITAGTPASAWDPQGHQLVGAVADQLLNSNARQQVALILGFSLQVAAPWPDCVRSIVHKDDGTFDYLPSPFHPEFRLPCLLFEGNVELDRMKDYAKRNWTNCAPTVARQCHSAYHFADIAIQRDGYGKFVGASDHDIVSAINAAILKLQDGTVPTPFSIKDKKEALFMLAHFVGDIHQPLHVGAVYLDANGNQVDPDATGLDPKTETFGGNSIKDGDSNLHSDWDKITETWGPPPDAAMLADAGTVASTPGSINDWAAIWASDTVMQARGAFNGLKFSGPSGHWTVQFPDSYDITAQTIKRKQLAKAGARLAQLLNKIWP
jgi:hypothetical protein